MAINKESNGFTFAFAIILVVVLGVILATLSEGLKPLKERNVRVKKQLDILSAMMDIEKEGITRANVEEEFPNYIKIEDAIILNYKGEVKKADENLKAFAIEIKKEYREDPRDKDNNYPLFIAKGKKVDKTKYIIPVVGKGLWEKNSHQ